MMLPVFPLLMLATTLGSVVLYLRTANDIFGVLAGILAIACLIWGLVVSHWSIHLLCLVVLFFLRKPKIITN
jgi:multisubunit Na+/H+ antiporter MnhG subunit